MKSCNYCIVLPFKENKQNSLQPFYQHYLKMETTFMNTEKSKTNETQI